MVISPKISQPYEIYIQFSIIHSVFLNKYFDWLFEKSRECVICTVSIKWQYVHTSLLKYITNDANLIK